MRAVGFYKISKIDFDFLSLSKLKYFGRIIFRRFAISRLFAALDFVICISVRSESIQYSFMPKSEGVLETGNTTCKIAKTKKGRLLSNAKHLLHFDIFPGGASVFCHNNLQNNILSCL